MNRYDSAFENAIQIIKGKRNPNDESRLRFFMEDIYTDNLDLFIREYDIFTRTKRSDFFYKANLANIAILLLKFHQRDFDHYFRQHDQSGTLDLDYISHTFDQFKTDLITVLNKAYATCHYTDVLQVYRLYLSFYKTALGSSLKDLPFDFYKIDDGTDIVTSVTQETHGYYIYLSCNHCAEFRQARFYMTRIIASHIGLKGIHGDAIISTLGCLYHDFYFHGNVERIKKVDDELIWTNRRFILALYKETSPLVYQYGLYALHIIQNEWSQGKIVKFDRRDFFLFFCYVKNNHLIMKRETDTYESVTGFLHWLTDKPFVLNNWDEDGRGYSIYTTTMVS
jgi:hypothetical protein